MKKLTNTLLALAAISSMTSANAPNLDLSNTVTKSTKKEQNAPVNHSSNIQYRRFKKNPHEPAISLPLSVGTPPKIYGQWLQSIGKQKWSKKQNKRK